MRPGGNSKVDVRRRTSVWFPRFARTGRIRLSIDYVGRCSFPTRALWTLYTLRQARPRLFAACYFARVIVPGSSRARMVSLPRGRDAVVFAGCMAAIAALAAVPRLLPAVRPPTVALALLLGVLGAATLGRLLVAIVVSIVAMLALNFFFLPPIGTFTIADPENWVALVVFLVVAVIASQLSAAAQERTREAVSRGKEVTRLFDLSRDVLLTTETAGGLEALARHISRRFVLARVAICLPG